MIIKRKVYGTIDYIRIPIEVAPFTTTLMILARAIQALIPSLLVVGTASFIDNVKYVFNGDEVSKIYNSLILIGLVIGFSWLSSIFVSFIKLRLEIKGNEVILPAVIKKRSCLHYKHIESNETWDLISKVGEDPSQKIMKGFYNVLNLGEYFIKVTSLIFIIAFKVWWVAILVLAIAVPFFILSIKSGQVDYEAFEESDKEMRRANYLRGVLSSREGVEERSLFGYTKEINKMWSERFNRAYEIEVNALKWNMVRVRIASIITVLLCTLIALLLIYPVSTGDISVGIYISLIPATFNLVDQMGWELSFCMQEYTKNKLYMKDFTGFSALDEVEGSDNIPDVRVQDMYFESIEFRNVHFSYPESQKKILNGLSMKLDNKKKYAFVGKNGAGKTTITKLLTGLYNNYEGEILINGKEIREYTCEELKAFFSVVYQDFAKYEISLKDNIILGKCGYSLGSNKEKVEVLRALQSIGMENTISSLPKGIESKLGKLSKDGIDLSGGQWQRVAIARNIISNAPIHILDEPTAALDPISEKEVYELFAEVSKGRSTILITHRLGAARNADEILVVDEGRILERGNHEELLRKKGMYKEMFEAQRRWYDEGA